MRKNPRISIIAFAVAFLALSVIYFYSPKYENKGLRYSINNFIGQRCFPYQQSIYSRKLRDRIPYYIEMSSSSGIRKCRDKKELMKNVSGKRLFKIRNGRDYLVEDLSYSYPYLTKDGKSLLGEIGKRFRKKISGTRLRGSDFKITSMTRTSEIGRRLRTYNSNASENSPHFYGNAFDLSYVRFSSPKWFITDCDKYFLKEALAQVIWQLREDRRCWATYEIKQGCFHVVAR